jgi:hypothetical protein
MFSDKGQQTRRGLPDPALVLTRARDLDEDRGALPKIDLSKMGRLE